MVGLFLRLGITAFGGPAAHIALMREEVVRRRGWLDEAEFVDLVGLTSLLPGPSSTELAIHIGWRRAGWPGLVAAGLCFIAPAAVLACLLGELYVRGRTVTGAPQVLAAVGAVALAVVVVAVVGLGRSALRNRLLVVVALVSGLAFLVGVNELVVLLGGAAAVALAANRSRLRPSGTSLFLAPALLASWALLPGALLPGALSHVVSRPSSDVDLPALFGVFLRVGALLFGSGYVLLAFLRTDLVDGHGWLTERQLVDGVAVAQLTPGPVFTVATFLGYVLRGAPGALVGTVAIFLPAFVLVAALGPVLPRLRRSPWTASLLDGVNAAAVGVMAAVVASLGSAVIDGPVTFALAAGALGLLLRTRVNPAVVLLGGAAAGVLQALLS